MIGAVKDGRKEVTMAKHSRLTTLMLLLILGAGIAVLVGCQRADKAVAEVAAIEHDLENATGEPAAAAGRGVVAATTQPAAHRSVTPASKHSSPRPILITVPAGTMVSVEMTQTLSSHTNEPGQAFMTHVIQDVAAEGRVAIEAGSRIFGRVLEAHPANKIGGRAILSVEFNSLELTNGARRPFHAEFAELGKSQRGKDAAIIGGGVIGGAILGEAVDEGEGTKIGAIVGGLAGTFAAKKTKGKPVELPAGSVVTLQTTQPVSVEIYP